MAPNCSPPEHQDQSVHCAIPLWKWLYRSFGSIWDVCQGYSETDLAPCYIPGFCSIFQFPFSAPIFHLLIFWQDEILQAASWNTTLVDHFKQQALVLLTLQAHKPLVFKPPSPQIFKFLLSLVKMTGTPPPINISWQVRPCVFQSVWQRSYARLLCLLLS